MRKLVFGAFKPRNTEVTSKSFELDLQISSLHGHVKYVSRTSFLGHEKGRKFKVAESVYGISVSFMGCRVIFGANSNRREVSLETGFGVTFAHNLLTGKKMEL